MDVVWLNQFKRKPIWNRFKC